MPRPSRATTRAIYAADRASNGELFDDASATPAVRNHKRPCAVCGVSALYAGGLCDSCRHSAAQLLVEHQTIATAHHDRLDAAWDAYESAVEQVTPAEFEAFGRMILAWEACRALPTNDTRVVAFRGKYSAARKHGGTFGTLVRAWHDWRMLTPQHEALEGAQDGNQQ
jgi:hypothetical protein